MESSQQSPQELLETTPANGSATVNGSATANGSATVNGSATAAIATFRIAPLIRMTLMLLYLSLMIPLPFLPQVTVPRISPQLLWVGIGLGAVLVYGAFSDRITVTEQGIQMSTPPWVPQAFRQGWSLNWADVQALKPRSTGQGGLVYYFLSKSGQGYLLPMRVAGFAQLVKIVQAKTGIDTTDIRPLAQPWMYFTLLGLTLLLLLVDAWTIWTALHLG